MKCEIPVLILCAIVLAIGIIVAYTKGEKMQQEDAMVKTPKGAPVIDYNLTPMYDEDGEVLKDINYSVVTELSGYDIVDTKLNRRDTKRPNIFAGSETVVCWGNFEDLESAELSVMESYDEVAQEVIDYLGEDTQVMHIELKNMDNVKCSSDSALTYMFSVWDMVENDEMVSMWCLAPDGKLYTCPLQTFSVENMLHNAVVTIPYPDYVFLKAVSNSEVVE